MINELVQNLIAINKSIEGQEMSFENALSIVKFYDEMPEPNSLIDEAEEMAASDIDALEKSVMKLKEESERISSVGMPMLKEVDFKAIAQNYSHTFYNRYRSDGLKSNHISSIDPINAVGLMELFANEDKVYNFYWTAIYYHRDFRP